MRFEDKRLEWRGNRGETGIGERGTEEEREKAGEREKKTVLLVYIAKGIN